MQSTGIPVKFPIPFGENAGAPYIRQVPTSSQIGITDGAASLNDGFVPLNTIPQAAGGVPPFMQDHNGILKQVTGWAQWFSAGGPIQWDSAFSAVIGGYPKGAIISTTPFGGFWLCTAENNTTNPDAGGAGWTAIGTGFVNEMEIKTSRNWTVPASIWRIRVSGVGGGGGAGGGDPTHCGSGGGAGGWFRKIISVVPGQVINFTVGAGGVSNAGDNPAGGGGTTSVTIGATTYCTGTGGQGGTAGNGTDNPGGAGGVASGGDQNETGGYGGDAYYSNVTSQFGGYGGASYYGGGGRAATNAISTIAMNGQASGSGAGGTYFNSGNVSGGTGASGKIVLEW